MVDDAMMVTEDSMNVTDDMMNQAQDAMNAVAPTSEEMMDAGKDTMKKY